MNDFDDEPTTISSERPTARPRVAVANDRFYVGTFERPDDYEVLHQAHRGAEGVVWRACYRGKLPWPVELAIKQLFTSPAVLTGAEGDDGHSHRDLRLVDRWNEQLKLLHLIHHKHLVRYQELFKGWPPHPPRTCMGEPPEELETWYFAMEWIEGSSLHNMIRHGEMSFEQRVQTIFELAQAVEHLHSGEQTAGLALLHRDIKPGNVIVSPGRGAVLVDYGLLRVEEPGLMTEIKSWTDPYLAPEVHLDKRLTSKASDIWAVAATAFFALTEKHPAPNPLETEMMERELETALRPKVARPHTAVDIVMEALGAGPKERPTSPTEWARRLAGAVGHPAGRGGGTSALGNGTSADTGRYARSGGSSRPVSFPNLAPYPSYIDAEAVDGRNGRTRRPTPPSGELVLRRPPIDLIPLDTRVLDTVTEPGSASERSDTVPAQLASLLKPVQPARTRTARRRRSRKSAIFVGTLVVLVLVTTVVALWGADLSGKDGGGPVSKANSQGNSGSTLGTKSTTNPNSSGPATATSLPATSLPYGPLVDMTNVSKSPYAAKVADVLGTYFGNIDNGDYQAAFDVYTPSEQATNSYAKWVANLSTTYDTRVIVTSIKHATGSSNGGGTHTSGELSVGVSFRSYQNPKEGPALEGCTVWSLDYTLVPDPGGALPYLIQLAQDTGAGPQGCYG